MTKARGTTGAGVHREGRAGGGKLWRLLKILTLIQANQNLRARDLARRCEVAERTIYRDIESLSIAGIPIYCHNGYRISEGFFLPPLYLDVAEAVALTVAGTALKEPEGTHYSEAIRSALEKIATVLPDSVRQLADVAQSRIKIHLRAFEGQGEAGEILSVLEDHVLDRNRCIITYFTLGRGETLDRKIDPYGLLFRERAWYLVAYCHRRNDVLLFRVDRIRAVKSLKETFQMPKDFSIEDYMASAWEVERGEAVTVRIRFTAAVAPLIRESKWHPTQVLTNEPGGSLIMTVTTGGKHELARWVLGFGGEAVVLEPQEWREEVLRLARGAVRANE